jgi:hypothetical protein
LPNVTVGSAAHNVVYVATENDSVYAFDADQTSVQAPLWHTNFLANGATVPTNTQLNCNDMVPSDGLSGTPVIDASTGTLYVVAMTVEGGNFVYRLHALDVTTGLDRPGSPVVIQATVSGSGVGSVSGKIAFHPQTERQRAALTLVNGNVYIGFGSFCDDDPYHGWILSYSASTLQQVGAYNDTPNSTRGGIWAAGGAVSADENGNIYYVSGNGGFDANTGGKDYGDSYVELSGDLKTVKSYFSPFNQQCLDDEDADLGSGGALLLPNQSRLIGAGKEGRIYVMNTNSLGGYTSVTNPCANQKPTNIDKVVQELPPSTIGGLYSNASYWQSASGQQYVYFAGANDTAKAFTLTNGLLSTAPVSHGAETFSFTGGNPTVSSNAGATGTGIVWTLDPTPALRAYDATNLGKELYNSAQNSMRDGLGSYVKFSAPTVANGEVFVGTKSTVDIFGLLSNPSPTPTPPTSSPTPTPTPNPTPVPGGYNNIGITNDNAVATGNYDGAYHSYSAEALGADGIAPGGVLTDNGFSFVWPNVGAANYDNYAASGQTIAVTPVSNADHLGLLGSATNGSASGTLTLAYADGSTQKVTVGFSDWSAGTPSFGNHIAAKMTYRNTKTSQQNTVNYLYTISIPLAAGETLQSITLPATVNGGQFHVFAVSTSSLTAPIYNNIGITDDGLMNPGFDSDNGNIGVGDFDGRGNTYSAQALQSVGITPGWTVSSHGFTFNWPDVASSESDNYVADGQTVSVTPVMQADHLAFLGSANGGATSGTATIHYSDGSTQDFMLGLSDWTLSAGKVKPSFGNTIVAQMGYRNVPGGGKQTVGVYLFAASVALTTGKTLTSVTLPATVNGGQIHVFAITTSSLTAPIYNNTGISNDGNITTGNFDGNQNSYSAQALQDAGLNAGDNAFDPTRTVTFTWPNVPAGTPDNYQATGQVIPVDQANNETILAFLGSATGGASSGTATITYTDGSMQTFTLAFSDWTLGAGKVQILASNQISYTTSYRNDPHVHRGEDLVKTYVFYTMVNIQSGKTVASVTLPATVTGGQMHVFAVTAK